MWQPRTSSRNGPPATCNSKTAELDQTSLTDTPPSNESPQSSDTIEHSENCGVTVMQTGNVGGQRKWDKKHFCFYCDEPQSKLPCHLQSCHKEEREVAEIASENNLSARMKLLLKIRNLGNHRHNCQVLRGW